MTSGSSKKTPNRHYEVGYGKPPSSGRFVKGVSGNPRGRPKKDQAPNYSVDTSLRDRFLEEAQRSVTVLEGGAPVEMTAVSAVMRAELIAALKGNSHAQRSILERAERYGKERAEEIEKEQADWRKYIDVFGVPGKVVPKGLPHPEDVVIEPGKPVWFRFGVDAEEAEKHWQTLCRFRDAFLIQSEIDFRHHKKNLTPGHDHKVSASLVVAISANSILPNRHKFDEEQFAAVQVTYMNMRQKELEDQRCVKFGMLGLKNVKKLITHLMSKEEIEAEIDKIKRKHGFK